MTKTSFAAIVHHMPGESQRVLIEVSKETHRLAKTRAFKLGKTLRQYVGEDLEPVIVTHIKKTAPGRNAA